MPNSNELCMYCLNPLSPHESTCSLCGHSMSEQNEPLFLRVRTVLSQRYVVGRVLEAGGDSALYAGYDSVAGSPCEIREFLPDTLIEREPSGTLAVISGCENTYAEYREKFKAHARTLARLRDVAAVIPTYDIFEENNTVYTVSEKVGGVSLESHLAMAGGKLTWDEARPLFVPLLNAFMTLHAAGMHHFGIAPENLLVASDGKLRVRGFLLPESRQVGSDLKPQLNGGYAAPEQYGFNELCDAATDVYGLTATLFRVLTGNPPPDGIARKTSSDLFVPTDVAQALPAGVKQALFRGLQVPQDKRIRTVEELRDVLSATPAVDELRRGGVPENTEEEEPETGSSKKTVWLVTGIVFAVLLIVAVLCVLLLGKDNGGDTPATTEATPPTTAATTTADVTQYYVVDTLVGEQYAAVMNRPLTGDMTVELASMQFSDAPKGQILSQEPKAGAQKEAQTRIRVVVSAGPEEITVPDVSGWTEAQARAYLEALGFTVNSEVYYVNVSSFPKGQVDSTDPVAGTKLPYGSTVSLRVSNMETTTTTTTTTTMAPPMTTAATVPYTPTP